MQLPRVSACVDFVASDESGPRIQASFGPPLVVLVAHEAHEVASVLSAAHAHALAGRWCVGFVRYEAAQAFDSAFSVQADASAGPLVWFGVHEAPLPAEDGSTSALSKTPAVAPKQTQTAAPWQLTLWQSALDEDAFARQVSQIHAAIADGEVYQVNLTSTLTAQFDGDALAWFAALHRAQPNSYAAFIDTGSETLLSVSPELFFDWRDGRLLSRPMKGTAARGASPEEDEALALALRSSRKEQAENLMIVDLIRNDLSRIAQPFSVQVPRLFETHAWPTVWQMTSDVLAQTRPGLTLADVFAALFPCGSVTGAPKVRAMHWIKQLEGAPRGSYCGAVGVLQPGGAATFNVAIRTISLVGNEARCGIGSGITADAQAPAEWQEWQNKQAFLVRCQAPFDLLETLGLHDGRLKRQDAHLARIAQAAWHFGYLFDSASAQDLLTNVAQAHPAGSWRVRLTCAASGAIHAKAQALETAPASVRFQLASGPMSEAHSEFVRFKTTRRGHYDAFTPTLAHVFDTLLWNKDGELTEFTRGNVALCLGGQWLTPALSSGLLPGILRAQLLHEGRLHEARLTLEDLARAEGLAFINSLRGWVPAVQVA